MCAFYSGLFATRARSKPDRYYRNMVTFFIKKFTYARFNNKWISIQQIDG